MLIVILIILARVAYEKTREMLLDRKLKKNPYIVDHSSIGGYYRIVKFNYSREKANEIILKSVNRKKHEEVNPIIFNTYDKARDFVMSNLGKHHQIHIFDEVIRENKTYINQELVFHRDNNGVILDKTEDTDNVK
ncbi:hypothetical protein D3C71_1708240 [compost metagenome]